MALTVGVAFRPTISLGGARGDWLRRAAHHVNGREIPMSVYGPFSTQRGSTRLRRWLVLLTVMAVAPGLNVTAGSAQAASAEAPSSVALTSVTLDPENSSGQTTNAPGAWSD